MLSDHKKKGKVFTPPLLSIATFVEAGWLDFAVPEFIWILLFMEKYGTEKGTILMLEFTTICDDFITPIINNSSAPCIISSYSVLTVKEKRKIKGILKDTYILDSIRNVLKPFLKLYPECPLNFIIPKSKPAKRISKKYLHEYKNTLEKLMHKTSAESTFTLAAVAAFLIKFHRISVVESSNIPPLNEVINYPNTEQSKHLASFLRTAIPMGFNVESNYDRKNTWVSYFWNQSFKLEPYKI